VIVSHKRNHIKETNTDQQKRDENYLWEGMIKKMNVLSQRKEPVIINIVTAQELSLSNGVC